jgi:transposase InsO family protein
VKRKFKATTMSKHDLPIAENHLKREFTVAKPNPVYVGDITYIPTQGFILASGCGRVNGGADAA